MSSDAALLLEAVDFAARKHSKQRRKDPEKTPYINHPIGVAHILTKEAAVTDIAVLQAALLHDTVEDTDTTLEEVEEHFGAEVRSIVEEVTDNKALSKLERKQLQVKNAAHSSRPAKLVKLADKLYNLRDLKRCTPVGKCNQQTCGSERDRKPLLWIQDGLSKGFRSTLSGQHKWQRAFRAQALKWKRHCRNSSKNEDCHCEQQWETRNAVKSLA